MKLISSIFAIVLFSCAIAGAQSLSTSVIDTPTAYTLERGGYQVNILGYDNGGVEMKTFIGLHDHIYLGVSFNVDALIGKNIPRPNVPGVIAKIKFTDGGDFFPAVSIGYDSFYIGRYSYSDRSSHKLNRIVYGPYIAFTSPIYLFDSEQHVNYGVRIPAQPDWVPDDTSYFIGIDIPLGEYFKIRSEVERIYWNLRRSKDWLFNFGIKFTYVDQLGIEFAIMYEPGERLNRVLRIEYRNQF